MNYSQTIPPKNKPAPMRVLWVFAALTAILALQTARAAPSAPSLEIGIAVRDVTPELTIWMAGYAARKRPADKIDHPPNKRWRSGPSGERLPRFR